MSLRRPKRSNAEGSSVPEEEEEADELLIYQEELCYRELNQEVCRCCVSM